jgi:putative two-component system hydrogenase maturation factor HypX/HoxX
MRILLLTHTFNSLCQRLHVELRRLGHTVSIEFDINDTVTEEAVAAFRPHLLVAPYLKRPIPESIWGRLRCIIIHPGPFGDRGPSALDWALMRRQPMWGVTALQANAILDGGAVWATVNFPMRRARKSSLYRNEVTEGAVQVLLRTLDRLKDSSVSPQSLTLGRDNEWGHWQPPMRQEDRHIDWARDDTETVLRKIWAADGSPGVLDSLGGRRCYLYDAWAEDSLRGTPGTLLGHRHGAILRATRDGAVWIGHLREKTPGPRGLKLPATLALQGAIDSLEAIPLGLHVPTARQTYREITYEEKDQVGYLHFEFYNGAMSTAQCHRLRAAYEYARARPTHVIVLMGGSDFWSNGLHLNVIEAADSPADESWRNIDAMNDLVRAIITTDSHLTLAALQGNAGAGGCFLALAPDYIYARTGIILNPHYKAMGNLYGSEYWTYLLPKRVGQERATELTTHRLPLGAEEAKGLGLIDDHLPSDPLEFRRSIEALASDLANTPRFHRLVREKQARRTADERMKPLEAYRAVEMAHMKLNFYGFDPSYHVARYHFVHKIPHARTPLYLAQHRRLKARA